MTQDPQKEYLMTVRQLIGTIHIDAAECIRCGASPQILMEQILDVAIEKATEIFKKSYSPDVIPVKYPYELAHIIEHWLYRKDIFPCTLKDMERHASGSVSEKRRMITTMRTYKLIIPVSDNSETLQSKWELNEKVCMDVYNSIPESNSPCH